MPEGLGPGDRPPGGQGESDFFVERKLTKSREAKCRKTQLNSTVWAWSRTGSKGTGTGMVGRCRPALGSRSSQPNREEQGSGSAPRVICVCEQISGKLLDLSEPQFPHLKAGMFILTFRVMRSQGNCNRNAQQWTRCSRCSLKQEMLWNRCPPVPVRPMCGWEARSHDAIPIFVHTAPSVCSHLTSFPSQPLSLSHDALAELVLLSSEL